MKVYYYINKDIFRNQGGCANTNFCYPFFKAKPNHNAKRLYFNENIRVFVMNDKKRKETKVKKIYCSKVPLKYFSIVELINYFKKRKE